MKELLTAFPAFQASNERRHTNKKLVILNSILIGLSVVYFFPVSFISQAYHFVSQHTGHIKTFVLVWLAINLVIGLVAFAVHLKVNRFKNSFVEDELSEEDYEMYQQPHSNGYTCIKVSGSQNMIWLNGHLFDLDANDTEQLVAIAHDYTLAKISN